MRILVFLSSLLLAAKSFAQLPAPEGFTRYTTVDGLSDNYVTGLAQDQTGFLWISTITGLNRFNGSRFVQFRSTDDGSSPATEEFTETAWLDDRRLVFYSGAGLHIVDTKTGSRKNLFIPFHRKQYLYKFNIVHGAKADNNGNLYVLTRSGFYHFKKDSLVWRFDYYREEDLDQTHVHFAGELFDFDERRLLIAAIDGFYLYDKVARTFSKMTARDHPLMAPYLNPADYHIFLQYKPGQFFVLKPQCDTIEYLNVQTQKHKYSRLPFLPGVFEFHYRTRLFAASDSLLYVTAHNAGFYKLRFSPQSGVIEMEPQKYFASCLCTTLLKDKDSRLWIGTNKGLFYENPQKDAVRFTVLPQAILDSFPAVRLTATWAGNNKVFVGTRGEAGLLVFDQQSLQYKTQILFDKKIRSNNQVSSILALNPSTLLLGTYHYMQTVDTRSLQTSLLLPPNAKEDGIWTADLLKDRAGDVWIGMNNSAYRYASQSKTFTQVLQRQTHLSLPVGFREDKQGAIWIASHGVARYDKLHDELDLLIDSFPFIKMPSREVNALTFDGENRLWISSNFNGLVCYDLKQKTFRQFTTRNGLPDNNVLDLIVVRNNLWIACASGLACLDLTSFNLSSFGKDDGFPDVPITKGAHFFYDSLAAELYLPFSTALTRFRPLQLLQKKHPPALFVENISVNGKTDYYLPQNPFTLSWSNNDVNVSIGSISFDGGRNLRYAYRDFETEKTPWVELESQSTFNIASLSPGEHRLQVKVYSLNNRWSPQVCDFYLSVTPPFWLQPWFFFVMGALLLFCIYAFIRWRIRVVQRKERIKTQIQQLKAEDYKAQFELEQISNYFSSSLANKKTEDEVLWDVAKNLIGRLDYEDCVIYMWNEEKTVMQQKAAYGPKGIPEIISADEFVVKPGQGIVGHVIETKQPLLVNDTRSDRRYRVDDKFRLSEVAVPILHDGALLGVIDSENSNPYSYNERDIKVLTTIATLIGNKLTQLKSEKELAEKQKELAGINEQLAEARLSALQAQMNPHFIFNALNSIKRMILDGDNEKASRYLSKFALMIRMTLEHSKETFVTLDENIAYLKAYLDMEKLRFEDGFAYTIAADRNVDTTETLLPTMMIQPLVENAIWHGLLSTEGDKKLRIAFSCLHNRLSCTVEDNGIGIRQSEKTKEAHRPLHRSVGLENLQNRIRIMNEKYNTACSLRITDLSETGINGSGTRVVLEMNVMTG